MCIRDSLDVDEALFIIGRYGEKQGCETAVNVQLKADKNERHAQRVMPDALPAPEFSIAVDG